MLFLLLLLAPWLTVAQACTSQPVPGCFDSVSLLYRLCHLCPKRNRQKSVKPSHVTCLWNAVPCRLLTARRAKSEAIKKIWSYWYNNKYNNQYHSIIKIYTHIKRGKSNESLLRKVERYVGAIYWEYRCFRECFRSIMFWSHYLVHLPIQKNAPVYSRRSYST